jgi:hypothetical protein
MSNNNTHKYTCKECNYHSNQKQNYDCHLLTLKHKRSRQEGSLPHQPMREDVPKISVDKLNNLLSEQYNKVDLLQRRVDELKKENNILITKLLELSEKQLKEKTTVTNNTTTNTNNNNQTYNINIYLSETDADPANLPLLIKGVLNKLMQIGNGDFLNNHTSHSLQLEQDENLQL